MKKSIIAILTAVIALSGLTGCHESLEERAAREAREYTEKCCPTPVVNFTRTDSVGFDIEKKEYIYHCSFVGKFDDEAAISQISKELHDGLRDDLMANPGMKGYVDAGFRFTYIVRSDSNPDKILFQATYDTK